MTKNDNTTELHRAASRGDIEGVKLLVSQGVKIDAKDEHGWTPLSNFSLRVEQLLNAKINDGKTKQEITQRSRVKNPEPGLATGSSPLRRNNPLPMVADLLDKIHDLRS